MGHVGYFHILATVNKATVNMGWIYLWISIFVFEKIPKSWIFKSYGGSIINFLRNYQTIFHNDCSNIHFCQQCLATPLPALVAYLFDNNHSAGIMQYLTLVLLCIFFNCNFEQLIMCLLSICIFSLKKCLFNSPAHF